MKRVELYVKVRRAVLADGMSRRGAARYFGIDRKTVDKILVFPAPPEHGRSGRIYRRKLTASRGSSMRSCRQTGRCIPGSDTRRSASSSD